MKLEGLTPLRVLFLCTANSARSQIAEALLRHLGGSRFIVGSAGSTPADEVHPLALEVLRTSGIDWRGTPKTIDQVASEPWDIVITVCDKARDSCPTLPGRPIYAHWGIEDPAAVDGEAERRRAFQQTLLFLKRRIDLLVALPHEKLERRALESRLRLIPEEEAPGESGR